MSTAAVLEDSVPASLDVVIIDDDDLTLEIVAWTLRDSQITHRLFTEPSGAVSCLRESVPRILIVDYYMPQINGIDFIGNLASDVDLAHSSVYLCSAVHPSSEQLAKLDGLGVSLLDKSIICDREMLLALVQVEPVVNR